jgi:alkylhydroperoxidase/carboxymuconolactone decarboxylase family protein YurZ
LNGAVIDEKLKALLRIAGKVQTSGRDVRESDIIDAKLCGATDREIHDTVLIAATFSMFNRYVDGLDTLTPEDEGDYKKMGERMVRGYAF